MLSSLITFALLASASAGRASTVGAPAKFKARPVKEEKAQNKIAKFTQARRERFVELRKNKIAKNEKPVKHVARAGVEMKAIPSTGFVTFFEVESPTMCEPLSTFYESYGVCYEEQGTANAWAFNTWVDNGDDTATLTINYYNTSDCTTLDGDADSFDSPMTCATEDLGQYVGGFSDTYEEPTGVFGEAYYNSNEDCEAEEGLLGASLRNMGQCYEDGYGGSFMTHQCGDSYGFTRPDATYYQSADCTGAEITDDGDYYFYYYGDFYTHVDAQTCWQWDENLFVSRVCIDGNDDDSNDDDSNDDDSNDDEYSDDEYSDDDDSAASALTPAATWAIVTAAAAFVTMMM